jgi:signal transduction histidine kinase
MSADQSKTDALESGSLRPDIFRSAIDASPHGIAIRKGDEILYCNRAWRVLVNSDTAREQSEQREIATTSSGFDYRGDLLTLTLAHDVSERRKTERQLLEAQKLEALGRWVGGVVHDFNNLLTAVMLYSDLVAQSADCGTTVSRYNEEIRQVARRGAGLTGQLLAFLHKQPHEPSVISANSLLKGLRDVIERMNGEDVQVAFELAPEPCSVKLDPAELQQLIFNLILNARDAIEESGTVTISTCETSADLGKGPQLCVELRISDTGCGMDAATRARVFEPFFTTKPAGKGTGLGLSTVRDIVAAAGGIVDIQSELGSGTTVTVSLPLASGQTVAEKSSRYQLPASSRSETILVVEDDPATRSSMIETLSRRGYAVLHAPSGDEALARAEDFAGKIDLLITDLILPKMSGRVLASRIAHDRPAIKVLFVSGYGISSGDLVDEFVFEKPFDSQALAMRVRQTLEIETPVGPE